MSNPYAVKSMDSLIYHANVCLEQAFVVADFIALHGGLTDSELETATELLLLEYSQRVDNILFHL